MTQGPSVESGAVTRDGLVKIKEVVDAKQPVVDSQLVQQAHKAVQVQVAKVSTLEVDSLHWDSAHAFEIPGQYRCVHAPSSADETAPQG